MLLPRATAIAIYDRLGVALWASDGFDDPELHRVLQDALASRTRGRGTVDDGFAEIPVASRPLTSSCYVMRSRDLLGIVGLVSREIDREPRPFSLVHGLLRPALECLERELASQSSIGDLQRSLVVRDRDLELLLGRGAGRIRRTATPPTTSPSSCRAASTISVARSARC